MTYNTADAFNYGLLKEFAKHNRNNPTDAERLLWQLLKAKAEGFKFRRQHIIGNYIADFVCLSKQVVIEVDGKYHNTKEQRQYDKERTEYLLTKGFRELRFTNDEVLQDTDNVIDKIIKACTDKTH